MAGLTNIITLQVSDSHMVFQENFRIPTVSHFSTVGHCMWLGWGMVSKTCLFVIVFSGSRAAIFNLMELPSYHLKFMSFEVDINDCIGLSTVFLWKQFSDGLYKCLQIF